MSETPDDADERRSSVRGGRAWLKAVLDRGATGVGHEQAMRALDAARDEPPTRHR